MPRLMMAQKHLHELLQEEQEPFLLKNYVADRRCQLIKKPSPRTHLQIKKRKPITQSSNFPSNFCKNACFFSFHDSSPDPRKSPLFEFPSPAKSPCKSPSTVFLHIPARTAALLLDAALRIQKQSSSKTKPQRKNNSGTTFSLFGSVLKRLTYRKRNRKPETANDGTKVSVKDILRWDLTVGKNNPSQMKMSSTMEEKSGCEMGFSCSYPSSAVWSESNEEKSLDMDLDTSCSCSQSEDFEEIFMAKEALENNSVFASCDKHFCESPFHFVLQRSPSFGHRTPIFSSPAACPNRHQREDKENYDVESLKILQVEEEEEEKDLRSPVSVFEPPFEDDDNDRHVDDRNDGFDLECTHATVQRAKQHLLQKLRRFEKLAELDPIELEKIMLEREQDDDTDKNGICDLDGEMNLDGFLQEVLKSSSYNLRHVPEGMKRLVSDLIAEEETQLHNCNIDKQMVAKRVCKRLDSWKEVESNTIDMMVEQDLRTESNGWKGNDQEQIMETALEVEYSILRSLMQELSDELLVSLTGFDG